MTWKSMTRQLGATGHTVFPLALGCVGMSGMYGKSEDDESVATIDAALDQGGFPSRVPMRLSIARDSFPFPRRFPGALQQRAGSNVPVIGARKRTQLTELLGALRFQLSEDDIARIEKAIPIVAVAGTRYDEHQMKMLDSERGKGS